MRSATTQAILLGMALGDALGRPVEFQKFAQIEAQYGPGGIQHPPDPALYTDDTQTAIEVTEGLLFEAGLNAPLPDRLHRIRARLLQWLEAAASRSPESATLAAVQRLAGGADPAHSGSPDADGSGCVPRMVSIGCFYRDDPAQLHTTAEAVCRVTHAHPDAVAASIAMAYTIALTVNGAHITEYVRKIMSFCDGLSEELDMALLRVGHVLGWTDEIAAMRHIGSGWKATEAVALALYCVLRYEGDYTGCVRRAANFSGASTTVAALAGAVSAARSGTPDALPADWVARCENRDYLLDLGKRMTATQPDRR
ncbi:MAG: ADP-ribosylglycohydrolase family protein [Chloroflexota bacterium]